MQQLSFVEPTMTGDKVVRPATDEELGRMSYIVHWMYQRGYTVYWFPQDDTMLASPFYEPPSGAEVVCLRREGADKSL